MPKHPRFTSFRKLQKDYAGQEVTIGYADTTETVTGILIKTSGSTQRMVESGTGRLVDIDSPQQVVLAKTIF